MIATQKPIIGELTGAPILAAKPRAKGFTVPLLREKTNPLYPPTTRWAAEPVCTP